MTFLIIPLQAFAVIFELDFDFGYDKQIYGVSRENSIVSRTYSGGLSTYLFELTAIDITASRTLDINTQNDRWTAATDLDVVADRSKITTDVYGIGIKQMFAGRNSFMVPVLSLGYAKEFVENSRDITTERPSTLARTTINLGHNKQRIDSMIGAFILQFKMTDRLSLKGSVKTLIPAFDFNKAKDNLKYSVGFSWIF
jgi:hypothetical protein